jgi:endonuclease G
MQQRLLYALIGACLLIHGCSMIRGEPEGVPVTARRELNARQLSIANANCYGGLPVDTKPDMGPTELIVRKGYVLEHSTADKIPLWVCESVAVDQIMGHLPRHNVFRADPGLKGAKSYPDDYRGSGYDRGHQAPAGNQTKDAALKDETFYMSNIAPQRPSLNRGIWKLLEDKTRSWVTRYGHAYEWTGPILCDRQWQTASAGQEPCQRQTIGRNAVAVPLYFYKIVLVQDHSKWKSIAFVVPNTDFHRPYHLEYYIRSIDSIERQAGIEFMPNDPASEQRALKVAEGPMWP